MIYWTVYWWQSLSLSVSSSTPDVSLKPRVSEASDLQAQQHNGGAPYLPLSRTPFPAVTVDQSIATYSGETPGVWLQARFSHSISHNIKLKTPHVNSLIWLNVMNDR